MDAEQEREERMKAAEKKSLLFKGPTVVAAIVCLVAAVFSGAIGATLAFASSALQGTLLINLTNGSAPSQALLSVVGYALMGLAVVYVFSAILLISEVHWIKGVYSGMVVSIVGMVGGGLGTTFAPGIAAAGMIINVLIVTLLATETWEATRAAK